MTDLSSHELDRKAPRGLSRVSTALAALLMALVLVAPSLAQAKRIQRFALVVGVNDGGKRRVKLRYAHTDARAMAAVLRQLGGLKSSHLELLIEPSKAKLESALRKLRSRVLGASGRREVIFYYSGHSDERGLLLGGKQLSYIRLRQALRALPSEVRIAVLDSCASGAITRVKGGVRRPPFLVAGSSKVRGHAFLTSASATESAQESDRMGGSFFTHYLVSGLRGAADADRDGRVTLDEAYRYAFDSTLKVTESTRAGPQHPNYDMELRGSGQLVLTDLRATSAVLELAPALRGRILVRDSKGRLVAELDKRTTHPLQLGLPPGRYVVALQQKDTVLRGEVKLVSRRKRVVFPHDLAMATARVAHRTRGEVPTGIRDEPKRKFVNMPFAFTVFPHLGFAGSSSETKVSLALLSSYYGRLRGVDISLGGAIATDTVWGAQIALGFASIGCHLHGTQISLGFNSVGAMMRGMQVTLGFNRVGGHVKGVQTSLGFNYIGGDLLSGAQISLGFSWTARDVLGAQIGLGFNVAGGDMGGIQTSLGFNIASGVVDGTQIALGANIGADVVDGAQIVLGLNTAAHIMGAQIAAAGVNIAKRVDGAQIGLINIGGAVQGAQIGLINIGTSVSDLQLGLINIAGRSKAPIGLLNLIKDGIHHLEAWGSEAGAHGGFKLGGESLYSIVAAAMQPTSNDERRWMLGIGFGGRIRVSERLYFDIDAIHYRVNNGGWENGINFLERLRFMVGYRLARHFAIFGGVALNVRITDVDKGDDFGLIPGTVLHEGGTTVRMGPGLLLGVSI